ncbi:hypothetical protein VTH82DRAFT_7953 [Thermothelomyces myriococcoides]
MRNMWCSIDNLRLNILKTALSEDRQTTARLATSQECLDMVQRGRAPATAGGAWSGLRAKKYVVMSLDEPGEVLSER